jgi:hypothetical protein
MKGPLRIQPVVNDIPSLARFKREFAKNNGPRCGRWANEATYMLMDRIEGTPAEQKLMDLVKEVLGAKNRDEWWRIREMGRCYWDTVERASRLRLRGPIAWWEVLDYYGQRLWDMALQDAALRGGQNGQMQERALQPDGARVADGAGSSPNGRGVTRAYSWIE